MDPKTYISCCGAYCKTCKPYIQKACKGCKIGYETKERDIEKARCKIKICCIKNNLETCTDCKEFSTCKTLNSFYDKSGHKYKKYKETLEYIKQHSYDKFIEISKDWKNAYGKLK